VSIASYSLTYCPPPLASLLNGETPQRTSYAWIGWLLLALAMLEMANHLRLFWRLPCWAQVTSQQNRFWRWSKVLVSIVISLAVIFGLPWLIHVLEGGAPNWEEPFRLMPDLTAWLLLGLSLNLITCFHSIAVPAWQWLSTFSKTN
jgi:hypothetical protein